MLAWAYAHERQGVPGSLKARKVRQILWNLSDRQLRTTACLQESEHWSSARAVCAFNRPIAPASGLHFNYRYTFTSLIPLNSMELSKLGDVTHPAML